MSLSWTNPGSVIPNIQRRHVTLDTSLGGGVVYHRALIFINANLHTKCLDSFIQIRHDWARNLKLDPVTLTTPTCRLFVTAKLKVDMICLFADFHNYSFGISKDMRKDPKRKK